MRTPTTAHCMVRPRPSVPLQLYPPDPVPRSLSSSHPGLSLVLLAPSATGPLHIPLPVSHLHSSLDSVPFLGSQLTHHLLKGTFSDHRAEFCTLLTSEPIASSPTCTLGSYCFIYVSHRPGSNEQVSNLPLESHFWPTAEGQPIIAERRNK